MAHQRYQVSLGEHGAGRWIAVFYRGEESTPWRAVQRAAWAALNAR